MNADWAAVPRTLSVTTDVPDGCTVWRVWWPCADLYSRGYIADYVRYGDLNLVKNHLDAGRYTVVTTPRMGFTDDAAEGAWLEIVAEFQQRGIRWLYDADDDLFSERFDQRCLAGSWHGSDAEDLLRLQRKSRLRLLELVDGVTVASHALAGEVRLHTSAPITYVPNGIEIGSYLRAVQNKPRSIPPVTVGWSGGPRLEADLDPMFEVWPRIAAEFPDVRFVVQGWCPPRLLSVMPLRRLSLINGQTYEHYPSELANIDIFCCFASDDPWITMKTPIKWWEATLAGSACVLSSTLYAPGANPPYDALEATTTEEWLDAIRLLIIDVERRRKIQRAAVETVTCQHTLHQTYADWLTAWAA